MTQPAVPAPRADRSADQGDFPSSSAPNSLATSPIPQRRSSRWIVSRDPALSRVMLCGGRKIHRSEHSAAGFPGRRMRTAAAEG